MTKKFSLFWDIILPAFSLFMIFVTCSNLYLVNLLEPATYVLLFICYLRGFYRTSYGIEGKWKISALIFSTALLFTAEILFFNNLLHFLEWKDNGLAALLDTTYWRLLYKDLTYAVGFSMLRYPALFLFCALGCFFFVSPLYHMLCDFLQTIRRRIEILFGVSDEFNEEDFLEFLADESEEDAVYPPFRNLNTPYSGDEPYIFISYAHKDKDKIMPIIHRMQEDGFRIWYDEGIDPGSEWDENIAKHVENCGYFVSFMSYNYLRSNNCKDELNYARDLDKTCLIVYLENTKLPSGMAMRLNRLQAIHQYTYTNHKDFYQKLYSAEGILTFRSTSSAKTVRQEYTSFAEYEFPDQEEAYDAVDCAAAFVTLDHPMKFVSVFGVNSTLKKQLLRTMRNTLTDRKDAFLYSPIEQFTNDLIDSVRNGSAAEFREQYTSVPILILDDLEFVSGKEATQEELYLLLKNRYFGDKPTFVFCAKQPQTNWIDYRIADLLARWHNIAL